eukprot:Lankesteria_metandrocarpae@DN9322_c0_g1_i1.p1
MSDVCTVNSTANDYRCDVGDSTTTRSSVLSSQSTSTTLAATRRCRESWVNFDNPPVSNDHCNDNSNSSIDDSSVSTGSSSLTEALKYEAADSDTHPNAISISVPIVSAVSDSRIKLEEGSDSNNDVIGTVASHADGVNTTLPL